MPPQCLPSLPFFLNYTHYRLSKVKEQTAREQPGPVYDFQKPRTTEQAESIMQTEERKVLLWVLKHEVLSSLSVSFSWLVKVFICSYNVFKIKKKTLNFNTHLYLVQCLS